MLGYVILFMNVHERSKNIVMTENYSTMIEQSIVTIITATFS